MSCMMRPNSAPYWPSGSHLDRRAIIAIAIIVLGVAVGAGVLIDHTAWRSARGASSLVTPSVMFSPDTQYEGRVLLTRSTCNGDGHLTGTFAWTRAPGTESDPYRAVAGPGNGTPLLG